MVLATHAIVGGAAATLFPSHPVIAFFAGFFSHFILDAIPHWDYHQSLSILAKVEKKEKSRLSIRDLLFTGTDAILGILVTLLIWHPANFAQLEILALGVIGGLLPDLLTFMYLCFPYQPMILIKKFHTFIHAKHELKNVPIGIFLQIVLIVCVTLLVKHLVQL